MLVWSTQNRKSCAKGGSKQSTPTIPSKYVRMFKAKGNFLKVFISLHWNQCKQQMQSFGNQLKKSASDLCLHSDISSKKFCAPVPVSHRTPALTNSSSKCRTTLQCRRQEYKYVVSKVKQINERQEQESLLNKFGHKPGSSNPKAIGCWHCHKVYFTPGFSSVFAPHYC